MKFKTYPRFVLILALFGTLLCVLTNEYNAHKRNAQLANQFGMVQTADETSYIVPPKNFISKGQWRDNSNGLTAYYQRPPGYGTLYLICYLFLGSWALLGLKIIQIGLFFFSVILFWRLTKAIGLTDKFQFITTFIFAFFPSYSGFVYYSITEGVTPFFVMWSVLSMVESSISVKATWQLTLSNASLLLIRPQLAIIPIAVLLYFAVKRNFRALLFLGLAFLPICAWYVRTGMISNEIPSLHPIYSKTNNHFYRPSHGAITDLFRIWEWRSDVFHNQTGRIGFGDSTAILSVANELPEQYREQVTPLLFQFRDLNVYRETKLKDQKITDFIPQEKAFIKTVYEVRNDLISQNLADYYLKTPFLSLKEFLNKSYLNLFVFQETFRGNPLMEILRVTSWLIFITSFVATFLLLFKTRITPIHFYIISGLGVFIFYLVFFQRLNEERYIVPILPLCLIFGIYSLQKNSEYFWCKKPND